MMTTNLPINRKRRVPLSCQTIVEDLQTFINVEERLRDSEDYPDRESDAASLITLHDRLVDQSSSLLQPREIEDFSDEHDQRIFARSVLLLTRFNECIATDDVLDTAGSRLLSHYRADFHESKDSAGQLQQSLKKLDAIDDSWIALTQQDIDRDLEDARRKQALVRAIRDEYGLHTENDKATEKGALSSNIFRFFNDLYPGSGLVAGEVDIIMTGALIFFCIPFEGTTLQTQRFHDLGAHERSSIERFLQKFDDFAHSQFAHFPVFGFLRGEDLDATVLQRLADRSGLKPQAVAFEITRLSAVIPLQEIDKFVAHDVWGHGWQASMLRFDGLYDQLSRYAQPLSLDETARDAELNRIAFGDCFSGRGDRLSFDESKFQEFVELEICERLPVAMTPVVAEIIADVAEFKIFATGEKDASELPSTSALKHYPAMLDLMIRDLHVYYWQATKVFRLWASKASRQQQTVSELVDRGASAQAADREVKRAVAAWQSIHNEHFERRLSFHPRDGQLELNVFTCLALNFLGVHREMLIAYEKIGQVETGDLPIRGFRDLLLIALAVFFEEDPPRNLWRMDEYLALRIVPLCKRLALASESTVERHN